MSDGVRSVLVVDEDGDNRHALAELLRAGGRQVTTARDGIEALEKLDSLERPAPTADRVRDYILAAQLFAAQLHLADGGHAAPPAQDALHTFVDLLWSSEWCVLAANGRLMPLTGGPFFYPDGLVTWSEQLSSVVG